MPPADTARNFRIHKRYPAFISLIRSSDPRALTTSAGDKNPALGSKREEIVVLPPILLTCHPLI
jgi:hypothetical protein